MKTRGRNRGHGICARGMSAKTSTELTTAGNVLVRIEEIDEERKKRPIKPSCHTDAA